MVQKLSLRKITGFASLSLLLISLGAVASIPDSLQKKKQSILTRSAGLTSKVTHKKLTRANNLSSRGDHKGAISLLKKLLNTTEKRPFEKAQVLQNLGYAYAQKEDYTNALKYLQMALDTNALPSGPTFSTMYTVAQLHVSKERYKTAIKILDEWFFFVEKPTAAAYILKASCYSELGNKKKALEAVDKALEITNSPKESWLQFSVALNYELKKYKAAGKSLKTLTGINPAEAKYWRQLSGIYLNLGNNAQALATLELAYKLKHLKKESELVNLATLYLDQDAPIKATHVLEKGIKAKTIKKTKKVMELLANSYIRAEELKRAIEPMTKAAAMSKDGKLYYRQGQLYLDQEDWAKALKAMNSALKKGGVKKSLGNIHMSRGIAYYNLKNVKQALKAFEQAQKFKKTERSSAQWITHIMAENRAKDQGDATAAVNTN